MEAVINTKDFLIALRKVMLASNTKQINNSQISNAIKIEIYNEGKMKITSYNFTVAIETSVILEKYKIGSICVNSKTLYDVVSKCANETISIVSDNKSCVIKSGKAVIRIPAIGVEEFPDIPSIDDIKPITVDAVELVEAANSVLYASAIDDKKPTLHGVCIEVENDSIELVACDGFRFSMVKIKADSDRKTKIIVPSETVSILSKIVKESNSNAKIFSSISFIVVNIGDTTVTSRLISGSYIDWKRTIPTHDFISCVFMKSKIIKTIEMAQTFQNFSKGIGDPIVFQINKNIANIYLKSQSGEFNDEVEFETNGELNLSIAFNPKYLIESIKSIESEKVNIKIAGALSPCLIVDGNNNDSIMNMLCPVRIRSNF